jgi:hypothetical protein
VNPNAQVAPWGQERDQRRAMILRLLAAKSHAEPGGRRVSTAWSVTQLAAALGVGERTVKRDLAELEAAGELYRERNPDEAKQQRHGGRLQGRNRYVLAWPLTSDSSKSAGRTVGPTKPRNETVSAGRTVGPRTWLAPQTIVVLKGTDTRSTPCGERGERTSQIEPWQLLDYIEAELGPVELLEAWGNHEIPPRSVRGWRTKQEYTAEVAAWRRWRRQRTKQDVAAAVAERRRRRERTKPAVHAGTPLTWDQV